MTPRSALLCLTLVALATPAAGADAAADTADVDLARLRAHLDFLADDLLAGRDTGAPGHEIAALYAATRFREEGLEPGNGDSFEQRIDFVSATLASSSLEARSASGSRQLAYPDDYLMLASPVRDEVSVSAPVVFAGYGIEAPELDHDDFAGLELEGKVLLELSGAPASFPSDQRAHYSSRRTKAEMAAAHGAVGVVTVRTRVDEARVPWSRMTANLGHPTLRWKHPDGSVQDAFPQLRFTALLSHAGAEKLLDGSGFELDALLDSAEALDYARRELPLEVAVRAANRLEEVSSPNVVAVLPGSDPALAGEYVVVSAHLDHIGVGAEVDGDSIYNGFYDNAMGSSILLEMARELAAAPERPRRSILFLLVTGEEKGLLGSDYFAHHPTVPQGAIVADVNVDMPLLLAPLADLVAFGAEHSSLEQPVREAARAEGFQLSPDPMPEEVIFVRSDQYSFVRRGIPSVYLSPGMSTLGGGSEQATAVGEFIARHYHRPSDEIALGADWDSVRRFVAANAALARAIADAAARPSWNPGDFFGERFGHGRAE